RAKVDGPRDRFEVQGAVLAQPWIETEGTTGQIDGRPTAQAAKGALELLTRAVLRRRAGVPCVQGDNQGSSARQDGNHDQDHQGSVNASHGWRQARASSTDINTREPA